MGDTTEELPRGPGVPEQAGFRLWAQSGYAAAVSAAFWPVARSGRSEVMLGGPMSLTHFNGLPGGLGWD